MMVRLSIRFIERLHTPEDPKPNGTFCPGILSRNRSPAHHYFRCVELCAPALQPKLRCIELSTVDRCEAGACVPPNSRVPSLNPELACVAVGCASLHGVWARQDLAVRSHRAAS